MRPAQAEQVIPPQGNRRRRADIGWYVARVRGMSIGEMVARARHVAAKQLWRRRAWPAPAIVAPAWNGVPVADDALAGASAAARERLVATADEIMAGRVRLFGRVHAGFGPVPDWFTDIKTGRRAPADGWCFDVPYRDPAIVGDNKFVWEPSRHFHLTQLAAAYRLTGTEAYAARVAAHLRHWWDANPPLQGIHWTSGIELGMRVIAWCWIRRLLAGWEGVSGLFEANPVFQRQLWMHQTYLATFESPGSSANNHLIAELAGLHAAATAFPLFAESRQWQAHAQAGLEQEIVRQTFPEGLNRELGSEYHVYVLELFLLPWLEREAASSAPGPAFSDGYAVRLAAMLDALCATLDDTGRPPRQGDGDGAEGLLVDGTGFDRVGSLIASGRALFGAPEWWPAAPETDMRTALWRSMATPRVLAGRPVQRPSLFPEAGMAILRDLAPRADGIWCRCDHGPHGFLSISGHAHADALSVELRQGGVDVLADPGTYCYGSELAWRRWERSTAAHNTLELFGRDQAESAGPFLWSTAPVSRLTACAGLDAGAEARWSAEHDGYARIQPGLLHRREVVLDRTARSVAIRDNHTGAVPVAARLTFQLGPTIAVALRDGAAVLRWDGPEGAAGATMALPPGLAWTVHRGETDPPVGWYSLHFGDLQPAAALVGTGTLAPGATLETTIRFDAPRHGAG